jgi:hypothetical protein
MPVSTFLTVMLTPGSTAPVWSLAVPRIVPVFWASSVPAHPNKATRAIPSRGALNARVLRFILRCLLIVELGQIILLIAEY